MNNIKNEIIKEIQQIYIDCPECEYLTDDEQYICTLCWCEGGNGKINVYNYIKEKELWKIY
jgi:hypothetical protein